jgi:predicted  nucleic acid-binding Zn-ribbon protein
MENEKLFEFMEKMYADLKGEIGTLKLGQEDLKKEVSEIKKTVIKIEDDHGKKLETLFDGYKQNSEQLNRIETEVSKHEEVILKRVK